MSIKIKVDPDGTPDESYSGTLLKLNFIKEEPPDSDYDDKEQKIEIEITELKSEREDCSYENDNEMENNEGMDIHIAPLYEHIKLEKPLIKLKSEKDDCNYKNDQSIKLLEPSDTGSNKEIHIDLQYPVSIIELDQAQNNLKNTKHKFYTNNKYDRRKPSVVKCNLSSFKFIKNEDDNSDNKPYSCDICHKGFCGHSNLIKHYTVWHTELHLPFSCNVCKNKVTFVGVKPCVCDACGKTFAQDIIYKLHNEYNLGIKKMYECNKCGKTFQTITKLLAHKRNCEDKFHRCKACSAEFNSLNKLKQHNKIHKDKPYSCNICGLLYKKKGMMNRHKKKH